MSEDRGHVRFYVSPTRYPGALVCTQCGALVADLNSHETFHALTPTVTEVALRVSARSPHPNGGPGGPDTSEVVRSTETERPPEAAGHEASERGRLSR